MLKSRFTAYSEAVFAKKHLSLGNNNWLPAGMLVTNSNVRRTGKPYVLE